MLPSDVTKGGFSPAYFVFAFLQAPLVLNGYFVG